MTTNSFVVTTVRSVYLSEVAVILLLKSIPSLFMQLFKRYKLSDKSVFYLERGDIVMISVFG